MEKEEKTEKVDWDGQVVDDKWYTRSIVILDYNITYGQLTAGYIIFVIIVIIISIIAVICIYKNREKVKTEFTRISIAIRASVAGRRQSNPIEDDETQIRKMDEAV